MQKVTTSSKGEPTITECPEKLSDRVLWLENIQLDMESSEIGIRWMEPDCLLSCCLETENVDSRDALKNRTFNINTVIQYTVLLSDEPNQHFHLLRDKRGEMCQVEIPKRVWTKINRQVYSLLKLKFPLICAPFTKLLKNGMGLHCSAVWHSQLMPQLIVQSLHLKSA